VAAATRPFALNSAAACCGVQPVSSNGQPAAISDGSSLVPGHEVGGATGQPAVAASGLLVDVAGTGVDNKPVIQQTAAAADIDAAIPQDTYTKSVITSTSQSHTPSIIKYIQQLLYTVDTQCIHFSFLSL